MADKPKHDTPVIIGLVFFTVFLVCLMFWLTLAPQISSGIRWVRVGELKIGSLFTDKYDVLIRQLIELKPEQISAYYLSQMTEASNGLIRIPIVVMTLIMAITCFLKKTSHPYTRRFNLEKMVEEHADGFPVVKPILKFNPLTANFRTPGSPVPDKMPIFAEALTPDEWVAFHSVPVTNGTIDEDAARRAFVKQLGGRWKGVDDLPWHLKALFAAFSMKANGKRVESDLFLGDVAQHWTPNKGLMLPMDLKSEIKKKIADPKFGRITEKVAAQHAFVAPALLRCLQIAREQGGVLAPAQFLWLRAVDRTIWYPLNNLGRGAVHAEAAGAMAHFRCEKAAGKPIPNPQVDIAIEGLRLYLADNHITSFPAKEFSRA